MGQSAPGAETGSEAGMMLHLFPWAYMRIYHESITWADDSMTWADDGVLAGTTFRLPEWTHSYTHFAGVV